MAGKEDAKKSRARHLRWRAKNPEKWRAMRAAQQKRYYAQFRLPGPRKRRLWTPADDAKITAKRRPTDRKLSKLLRRSIQATSTQRADQVDALEPLSHRSHPNVAPNVRCHRDDKIAEHYDSDSSQRISQSFRHQIPRSLTGLLLHAAGTKSTPRSKVISQSLLRQAATTYNGGLWDGTTADSLLP